VLELREVNKPVCCCYQRSWVLSRNTLLYKDTRNTLMKHIILIGFPSTFTFLYIDINIHFIIKWMTFVWLACFISELKMNTLSAFISFARPVSFVFAHFIFQNSARRGRVDLSFATARRAWDGRKMSLSFFEHMLQSIDGNLKTTPTKINLICWVSTLTTEQRPIRNRFPFSKPRAGFKDTVSPFLNLGLTTQGLFAFFPQTYNYPEGNCSVVG